MNFSSTTEPKMKILNGYGVTQRNGTTINELEKNQKPLRRKPKRKKGLPNTSVWSKIFRKACRPHSLYKINDVEERSIQRNETLMGNVEVSLV